MPIPYITARLFITEFLKHIILLNLTLRAFSVTTTVPAPIKGAPTIQKFLFALSFSHKKCVLAWFLKGEANWERPLLAWVQYFSAKSHDFFLTHWIFSKLKDTRVAHLNTYFNVQSCFFHNFVQHLMKRKVQNLALAPKIFYYLQPKII